MRRPAGNNAGQSSRRGRAGILFMPSPLRLLPAAFIFLAAAAATLPATITPVLADEPAATVASAPAQVVSFEGEAQLEALAAKGTTVVFFYAAWCPSCRATVTELNANWDKVNPGLTLVIADYDKEQALKSKFGVTYQDTFVLLDRGGKGVAVWNSGGVKGLNAHTSL
jgi:thiol-disulfide isomerase/thioredoxin